jgi:ADP-heptose:LPS heptosyltransferase
MIFAKKLKATWAVGFRMSTYTRSNIFNKVQHHFVKNEARRPREILNEIGLEPIEGEDLLPIDPNASSAVKGRISKFFSKKRLLVVLNPGAKLKASQWPPERFGEISRRLAQEYEACVLLNGAESEKSICDEVVETSGGIAINLAGLSVRELIELLRISDLLITNNTGPMTLSAMIGTPTVVISGTRFSPTFYMPISERTIWVFSFQQNSYSYKDDGGPSEDLLNVQVSDVINAVKELIPRKLERVSPANVRRSAL